jgi:trafficking protein particle complex subunit 12
LIEDGNSFHALTFNLSTIYELCTERSRALKIDLAEKVVGIQIDSIKAGLGTEGTSEWPAAWEKVNGDFKL